MAAVTLTLASANSVAVPLGECGSIASPCTGLKTRASATLPNRKEILASTSHNSSLAYRPKFRKSKASLGYRTGCPQLTVKATATGLVTDAKQTGDESESTSPRLLDSNFNYVYKGQSYFPLPLVDLNGLDDSDPSIRAKIVKQLHDSANEFGLLCVVNHNIPIEVLDGVRNASRAFFSLPLEEKLKSDTNGRKADCHVRPVGYRQQFKEEFVVQRRETFEHQFDPATDPALTPWPEATPDLKKFTDAYSDGLRVLSPWIYDALSEGLGLPRDALRKNLGPSHQHVVLAHYPPIHNQPAHVDPHDIGFGAHSDLAAMNIVLQDHVGGFQIFLDSKWIDTPPCLDALVYTIGGPLECQSNGKYHAIVHRVRAPKTQDRFSLIATYEPFDQERMLYPEPELGPLKYKAFAYGPRMRSILNQRFDPAIMTKEHMVIDSSTIDETRNFSYKNGVFNLGGVPFGDIAKGY